MLALKAVICSAGVVLVWLFCAAALIVPLEMVGGAFRPGHAAEAWFALVLIIAIAALAYDYPRYASRYYEKLTGKRVWFSAPPGRRSVAAP